jgi:asparagine synthase (glutamine-hydrolysing)
MLNALTYERAQTVETFCAPTVDLGCVHLGIGGEPALYESDVAVVGVYGYAVLPSDALGGASGVVEGPVSQARRVHDLYLACGPQFVQALDGTCLIVVWDKRQNRLAISNDRLGLRPLFYAVSDSEEAPRFLFASEVKALLCDPLLPKTLDEVALAQFFTLGYLLENHTFFEAIKLLDPGSILTYQDGRWSIQSYWRLSFPNSYPRRSDAWYEELIYNALQASIGKMVRPDRRYGVTLSGGMDSRWMAALLTRLRPDTPAFTFGSDDAEDVSFAIQVATRLGMAHYRFPLSSTYIAEHGARIAYATDGMYNILNAHEFVMSVEMGRHVDVAIGGMLGDDLFGRTVGPRELALKREDVPEYVLRKTSLSEAALPDAEMRRLFGVRYDRMKDMAYSSYRVTFAEATSELAVNVRDYQNFRQSHRRRNYLGQIVKEPYIQVYHPFSDSVVLEAALQVPPGQRFLERAYRRTLCRYFPELADIEWPRMSVPPSASATAILGKQFFMRSAGKLMKVLGRDYWTWLQRRQRSMNYGEWLRGPLRGFVESMLLSESSDRVGLFCRAGLRQVVNAHLSGQRDFTAFMGSLLTFELWSRMFAPPGPPRRPETVLYTLGDGRSAQGEQG